MKSVPRSLVLITVTGALTGRALAALADTAKGKPFEGVVVEDVVVVDQFPTEVQGGSVQVTDDKEATLLARAKISASEAARIAEKALTGKVVETRLDEENGYLVWEAEVIGGQAQVHQLKIDAGNGRLLAIGTGEKGEHEETNDREDRDGHEHSRWKFWEDNDRDEKGGEHD